jgi:hypothetical protein
MLIVKLIWGLQATIIDVETAFLHGNLMEEIYMNIPEGMKNKATDCLRLKELFMDWFKAQGSFVKGKLKCYRMLDLLKTNPINVYCPNGMKMALFLLESMLMIALLLGEKIRFQN